MNRAPAIGLALWAALLASACAGEQSDGNAQPSSVASAAERPATTPRTQQKEEPQEQQPGDDAEDALPPRAEMDAFQRALAEAIFMEAVHEVVEDLPAISDGRLIGAAHAACDSFDRGDSDRAAYIVIAGLLPELTDIQQPVGIGVVARSIICPEHSL